jgi:hypothetical protein
MKLDWQRFQESKPSSSLSLSLRGFVCQVSISSTFYIQIFRTNIILAAFSSYILALAKKLYKKGARKTLMKLMAGESALAN